MPYEFMGRADMEKMIQASLDSAPMDSVASCLECSSVCIGACEHQENDRPPSHSV